MKESVVIYIWVLSVEVKEVEKTAKKECQFKKKQDHREDFIAH